MTKLISGRVAKIPSANVSADRHEFIDLAETEPDLGLPSVSGWVLSSDTYGNRIWVDPVQASGGTPYFANTSSFANIALAANFANTSLVANVALVANSANTSLVANVALLANSANTSLVANVSSFANVANTVLSIDNFTTTNLKEGSNLYYTDYRVLANVTQMSVNVFADVDITGIVPSGILTWDGTKFIAGTITTGAVANTSLFSYIANVANTVLSLSNFTTANLAESPLYLFYSNTRVNAFVQPFLTTANVSETSGNLYFTNARVVSALIAGQNITIEANGRISANASSTLSASTTDSLPEGTNNLYYSNARVNAFVQPFLTTANVSETSGNLYFTTERVNAFVQPFLTTANVTETSGNLYYTNARARTAFTSGDQIINIDWNAGTISANVTTDNVVEGTNQYFTNARVVSALTAGKGISIGTTGIISSYYETTYFNTLINGAAGGNVSSSMSPIVTFTTYPTTDRFLLHSIHVVNTSTNTALISANIRYATGNVATLANQIPIPQGGVLEFMKAPQLFQPGDTINLQGFNNTGVPTANLMTYIISYQPISTDVSYIGVGQNIANVDTNTLIYDSFQGFSVVESIKFVNLQNTITPVKAYWGDANGVPKAYFAYNLPIPPNSSVELLQIPKKLEIYDRIYASYSNGPNAAVAAFVSAKLATVYTLSSYQAAPTIGSSFSTVFSTSEPDGTILYYTIE